MEESQNIKGLLNSYALTSGQAVNFKKSGIFFILNVRRDKQRAIKDILEVHTDLLRGIINI